MPFCPQCGAAVTPEQNFCTECDAALKPAKGSESRPEREIVASPEPAGLAPRSPGSQKWIILGGGIILLVILVTVFAQWTRKSDSPPAATSAGAPSAQPTSPPSSPATAPKDLEKTPARELASPAQPSAPAAPQAASLQAQLEKVIENLREANLKKDLVLYMSCFSYVYPQLDKKRQEALKTWKDYDFKRMVFTLGKVTDMGPEDAMAEVSWNMSIQNRASQDVDASTISYRVWFAKELGQWKIKRLEEMSPE